MTPCRSTTIEPLLDAPGSHPFDGGIDVDALETRWRENASRTAAVLITVTNDAVGGHPMCARAFAARAGPIGSAWRAVVPRTSALRRERSAPAPSLETSRR